MVQAVPVQLPEGLKSMFVGAAPHITISFAARATAKHAGKQLPQKLMMLRHLAHTQMDLHCCLRRPLMLSTVSEQIEVPMLKMSVFSSCRCVH